MKRNEQPTFITHHIAIDLLSVYRHRHVRDWIFSDSKWLQMAVSLRRLTEDVCESVLAIKKNVVSSVVEGTVKCTRPLHRKGLEQLPSNVQEASVMSTTKSQPFKKSIIATF